MSKELGIWKALADGHKPATETSQGGLYKRNRYHLVVIVEGFSTPITACCTEIGGILAWSNTTVYGDYTVTHFLEIPDFPVEQGGAQ
jgi:hypothetical protein